MCEDAKIEGNEIEKKNAHVYPLVKYSEMNEEMRVEAMELAITACEKFANNYEQAAKTIKETMDKRLGTHWHVVVGEAYGYEISYETRNILYLFFGGNLAILAWKCS